MVIKIRNNTKWDCNHELDDFNKQSNITYLRRRSMAELFLKSQTIAYLLINKDGIRWNLHWTLKSDIIWVGQTL